MTSRRLVVRWLAAPLAFSAVLAASVPAVASAAGPVPTSTTAVVDEDQPTFGDTVTITVTVAPEVEGTTNPMLPVPEGTVELLDGATVIDQQTLSGGTAQFTVQVLTPVSWALVARYVGSDVYDESTSAPVTMTVGRAATTATLGSAPNPAVPDEPVTFTVAVSGVEAAPPTGTVRLLEQAVELGSAALDAEGTAAITLTTLPPGVHEIVAVYDGSGAYDPSSSAAVLQEIERRQPTITVSSTANPAIAATPVTISADVSGVPSVVPTGTITFSEAGEELATVALDESGTAAYTTSSLAVGAHSIEAAYSGDASYVPTDAAPAFVQEVRRVGPGGVAVTSSSNPAIAGTPLTVTAVVTATAGGPQPTGTVTFSDDGTDVATVPLDEAGMATFTTSSLPVGTHTLDVAYSGDASYLPASAETPLVQQVEQVAPAGVTLTSSSNPAIAGSAITFTADVAGVTGGPVPTGFVTFRAGSTVIGTAELDGGQAQLTTSSLAAGSHSVRATYNGDVSYLPLESSVLTQTVERVSTSTSLAVSTTMARKGQAVTITAFVGVVAGKPTATGKVTFTDAGATLGTATLSGGQASLTVTSLAVGGHTLRASYTGTVSHSPSSTPTATVVSVTTARPGTTPSLGTTKQFADSVGEVSDCRYDLDALGATYGQTLTLAAGIECATNPGTDPAWSSGNAGILWALDVRGDDAEDYVAVLWAAGGMMNGLVFDPVGNPLCPATPSWNGAHVYRVVVSASCLGTPSAVRMWAAVELPTGSGGSCPCGIDEAPDTSYYTPFVTRVLPATSSGSPPPPPKIVIKDAKVTEGHKKTKAIKFTVTLSSKSSKTVTVKWATANGNAKAGSDYVKGKGTVTFKPGQTKKTITVKVKGDRRKEKHEKFVVKLSSPKNATIKDGKAIGTIRNDDR